MNSQVILFWSILVVLFGLVYFLDLKYNMLRDLSKAPRKPYSYGRVQLAWWSVIVLAAFVAVTWEKGIPTLDASTLILLGISCATTGAGRLVDLSDITMGLLRDQDRDCESFFIDILSDANGINIQRFQALVFNVTFGIWFVLQVSNHLPVMSGPDGIIPAIDPNNLVLLGLSSGTYAALKTTENRSSQKQLKLKEKSE
jgi:hypothetical protein